MAAPIRVLGKVLCRTATPIVGLRLQHKPCSQIVVKLWARSGPGFELRRHSFCTAPSVQDGTDANPKGAAERYKDTPWEYLESEEYIERYGSRPVWADYRRNHKGGIPPQKTRRTCIRGDKTSGNPCPICRDPNVIIHHQNVKLLQQFINPYTGTVYEPTRTGVCMKQQKVLDRAVNLAKDHGLLPFQIPYVEFLGEDYSNSHDAVGSTPTRLTSGEPWYSWYGTMVPDEKEVAKVKKTYKAYLK
ncbi:hypothetical protein NHX12_024343 [Muraenolepis orangiensis]|uniref:Small ribosomal subunit protein mS40 n=1 Tax=Muraenolepis orangiensis TaxID=630683 RepID=A0A9Q0EP07_9TELE|nr:hypothetical protein NHX12_024343 [Muraenolepis orangiensis]